MLPRERALKAQETAESHFSASVTFTPGCATIYYCVLSFTWGLHKYFLSSHVRDFEGSGALPSAVENRGQQMRPLSSRKKYSSIIQDGSQPTAPRPFGARARALEKG